MATFTLTAAAVATPHPVIGAPGIVGPAFQVTAFQPNAFQTIWLITANSLAVPHPVIGSSGIVQPNQFTAANLAIPPPQMGAVGIARNIIVAMPIAVPVPTVGPAGFVGGHFNFVAANLSSPSPVLPAPLLTPNPFVQPLPITPAQVPVQPVSSGYVLHNQDDFASALADLLPTGPAWPRDFDSVLMQLIFGMAGPWADDALAADALLEIESDPNKATIMLPDWEKSFGLPDKCLAEPLTIADRRRILIQRMTLLGAADRNFIISMAATIGYTINRIIEFSPYMCGISRVGDTRNLNAEWDSNRYRWELGDESIRYWWIVRVGAERLSYFHCAAGICGVDRLLSFGFATDLECLLRRLKPAHTDIIFDYSQIVLTQIPAAYVATPQPALGTPPLTVH
jgi:uncharacterized protein YmfQ (DUF2313 family)